MTETDEPATKNRGAAHPSPALMTALTTEHFVLQAAATTTVSEATGRAGLYFSALSSGLIALGFAAQTPDTVAPFAAILIPAVVILGVFTTVRLVDTGVQNLTFLAAISRIRARYRALAPDAATYFAAWGQLDDDAADEALASMSLKRSLWIGFGTTASMVATVNSIVAGVGTALGCVQVFGRGSTYVALLVGAATIAGLLTAFYAYQNHRYQALQRPPRTTDHASDAG
jgi:uncharacterized iron-regulated membrane protein